MKKNILILAALAAIALPAHAEKISLTLNQVFILRTTLAKLDAGITQVVKQPAAEGQDHAPDKIVVTAHDFAPAVRLAIYRNQRELTGQLEDFQKSLTALEKKIWGDRSPDHTKDSEEQRRYIVEFEALANTSVKVELTKLSPKDLIAGGNPIPTQILLDLRPILTE